MLHRDLLWVLINFFLVCNCYLSLPAALVHKGTQSDCVICALSFSLQLKYQWPSESRREVVSDGMMMVQWQTRPQEERKPFCFLISSTSPGLSLVPTQFLGVMETMHTYTGQKSTCWQANYITTPSRGPSTRNHHSQVFASGLPYFDPQLLSCPQLRKHHLRPLTPIAQVPPAS